MKRISLVFVSLLLVLATAASVVGHHSLAQFDTTKPVTVKGTVVLFHLVNPHSIIFVDEKRPDGQIERWAVDGPGINQLTRQGIDRNYIKAGDVVEVCGYVLREGLESQRTVDTEPISLSLKDKTPKSVSGRIMNAESLVRADGQKRPWGDYGQHHCLGADYKDVHLK